MHYKEVYHSPKWLNVLFLIKIDYKKLCIKSILQILNSVTDISLRQKD